MVADKMWGLPDGWHSWHYSREARWAWFPWQACFPSLTFQIVCSIWWTPVSPASCSASSLLGSYSFLDGGSGSITEQLEVVMQSVAGATWEHWSWCWCERWHEGIWEQGSMDVWKSADREKYSSNFTSRAFLHIRQKAWPLSVEDSSHSLSEVPLVPLGCAVRMNFAIHLASLDLPRILLKFLFYRGRKSGFGNMGCKKQRELLLSCL